MYNLFLTHNQNEAEMLVIVLIVKQRAFLSLSTVPPSVSEIIKPEIIYADVPADLKCTIRGAREKDLKVKWFKVGGGVDSVIMPGSDSPLLDKNLSEQASFSSYGRDHTSVLPVCLSVTEDQTRYQCVVLCNNKRFSKETTVHVKGESSK